MKKLGERERKLLLGLLVVVAGARVLRALTATPGADEAPIAKGEATSAAGADPTHDVVALDSAALLPKSDQLVTAHTSTPSARR